MLHLIAKECRFKISQNCYNKAFFEVVISPYFYHKNVAFISARPRAYASEGNFVTVTFCFGSRRAQIR